MRNESAAFVIGGFSGAILTLFLLSGPARYTNTFYRAGYHEGMLACFDAPETCQRLNEIRQMEKSLRELKEFK